MILAELSSFEAYVEIVRSGDGLARGKNPNLLTLNAITPITPINTLSLRPPNVHIGVLMLRIGF